MCPSWGSYFGFSQFGPHLDPYIESLRKTLNKGLKEGGGGGGRRSQLGITLWITQKFGVVSCNLANNIMLAHPW